MVSPQLFLSNVLVYIMKRLDIIIQKLGGGGDDNQLMSTYLYVLLVGFPKASVWPLEKWGIWTRRALISI